MVWDPFGTPAETLWITGGRWAGKSTVADLLTVRCGLIAHHYDHDDARGRLDRRIAEEWGLRPERVAPVARSPRQVVVMVPTDGFRLHQAAAPADRVSDPEPARRNRVERGRLIAADAVRRAREPGIRVLEVDGSRDAEAVADVVAEHFGLG